MELPGIIALAVCCTIVLAKMVIGVKLRISRNVVQVETEQLQSAKKDLNEAINKGKQLRANLKQVDVQRKSLTGAIDRLSKQLNEMRRLKATKDAIDKQQNELSERLRRQVT